MSSQEVSLVAGVDEAGRGPWAGPVVAAAVILDLENPIEGLTDSKKLSEKKRDRLFEEIVAKALTFGVGQASVEEIDNLNILQATFLAMQRAVAQLKPVPTQVLVDGSQDPGLAYPTRVIVQGDLKEPCISAASILAKVTRDRLMVELDAQFPGYGFGQHKGYGTKIHQAALKVQGVSPCHRRSFRPVLECL